MGSHYQYQYAQQTGKLFTDLSQLQPGDLVFIDSGNYAGAGANLNNAGHVAVYIGNGQILQAANPQTGTIISPLSGYQNILGGMKQSFSGGFGGGFGGGAASNNPYRKVSRF
jgi:cell wall-associated NlpC family hydrolase